jgi:hypothetical protein
MLWRCPSSCKNNLTRRANHLHIFIIATIKPAPETGRGLSYSAQCHRSCDPDNSLPSAEPGDRSKPNWQLANADPA